MSLQLSFAVVPLVMFTSDREDGPLRQSPRWLTMLAWIVTVVIIVLNVYLLC